jgi:hypothetical protein
VTTLSQSTWSWRPPLEPLSRELQRFVRLANTGHLKGQLDTPGGIITDLQSYVIAVSLDYLTGDADAALERLSLAYQAFREQGLEPEPELEPSETVYPVSADAVYRPCRACRTPITFVVTERGAKMPVTRDGVSHYRTCTEPKRFSLKGN